MEHSLAPSLCINVKNEKVEKFIKILESEFSKNANTEIAIEQKAYMKNHFEFYGIKTQIRREIQKPFFIKEYLPPKKDLEKIIKTLWVKSEREYQYFSQELAHKYIKQLEKKDIKLFEFMVINKSWWDTTDFIAPKLIGEYFKVFPKQRDVYVRKWVISENIWLQRSSILFQLNYKDNIDTELLTFVINSLFGSKEFFINKAIGWILRNYSRTNPNWVIDFTNRNRLNKLSRKEALRLIE
ncbi:DNA alkylation repair enzyme [bacterium BMS3Abin04]|nr:DNA alkylation repair enzyme [bacterium BMS3Abin04]